MVPDKQRIKNCLTTFHFEDLFVEELGWDRLNEHPFAITTKEQRVYTLKPLVEKRGVKVYVCDPDVQGCIPNDKTLRQIDRLVEPYAHEHLIIYVDAAKENQTWQWVKREQGKSPAHHINKYHKGRSAELLTLKLLALAFSFEEEESLTNPVAAGRLKQAFDVEKVTKKFYERFKKEHDAFLTFVEGIADQGNREWYTSLMLNRLMFIYFIQKKGFLDTRSTSKLDGDTDYLRHRLKMTQEQTGYDTFHSFYHYFLLKLFHEGLNKRERSPELEQLLGKVPYLNGGLFDIHVLERDYPGIQIHDKAFERLFDFFEEFDWHLDDRSTKSGNEINPDVLGYIFEKYINQKQMGAYYTKEDITEYISKTTIIPYLFEATEKKCHIAFTPGGPVWSLLRDNPDDYIYEAVATGTHLPLPPEIEEGIQDVSKRTLWNKPAPEAYALPTERWREVLARRTRYEEVRGKIAEGEITHINDLITDNLDLCKFAQDVIMYSEGPDLLLAFYESIETVTVLDPTCGSGAFLFAALNILKPLYEACLVRMQAMVDERDQLDAPLEPQKRKKSYQIERFGDTLQKARKHHSREYFILKSVIIKNLYGVDIMEEAIEICKLRLFLKLVAQVEKPNDIEPLPDIDFNILAGNSLVGFTSLGEVRQAVEKDLRSLMTSADTLTRIEQQAKAIEQAEHHFRETQTQSHLDNSISAAYKQQLRLNLDALRSKLDLYLASEYGIDHNNIRIEKEFNERYAQWQKSYQPFHWFVEFYGILSNGGFDVIIGNPPYVEYNEVKFAYTLRNFKTLSCANLYTCIVERSHQLLSPQGCHGMILPLAAFATKNMIPFIESFQNWFPQSWISFYHFRPSMLFSGGKVASIPTTIYIAKAAGVKQRFSTHLTKWPTEQRDLLFSSLIYCPITVQKDAENRHYYPKLGQPIENAIMEKVLRHQRIESYLAKVPTQNTMFYRSAGGLYWKVFVNYPWPYQTTSNKQCDFQEHCDRDVFVGLFNSSLFWWYYTVTFDTFNLKDYMIFGSHFSYPENTAIVTALRMHCQRLMNDFSVNARHLMRGKTGSYTIYARKSKTIIDDIDHVLAKHYGFSDEELDFIINYDIKYRMGQDNEEESEE